MAPFSMNLISVFSVTKMLLSLVVVFGMFLANNLVEVSDIWH